MAQTTSRGSAVARSTLEELKFAVPKSFEDIVFDGWEGFFLNLFLWFGMWNMERGRVSVDGVNEM